MSAHGSRVHVDARKVHLVGRDLAGLDELLHLGDREPGRHRAQGVEVARSHAEHQVSVSVAPVGPHQRDIWAQGLLHDEDLFLAVPVEDCVRLGTADHGNGAIRCVSQRQAALGHLGADAGPGVEGCDA